MHIKETMNAGTRPVHRPEPRPPQPIPFSGAAGGPERPEHCLVTTLRSMSSRVHNMTSLSPYQRQMGRVGELRSLRSLRIQPHSWINHISEYSQWIETFNLTSGMLPDNRLKTLEVAILLYTNRRNVQEMQNAEFHHRVSQRVHWMASSIRWIFKTQPTHVWALTWIFKSTIRQFWLHN